MPTIDARATADNSADRAKSPRFKASRHDAPVICPVCERRVDRQMRGQRYCSRRCRQKANYAAKVARGDFSTRTIARPTTPPKRDNKLKDLQRAKTLSSHHVLAPAYVLAEEVFNRPWESATSSAGVAIEIGRLRHRALVAP
jgi:uncharacterized Zn finger protein (UPF0148 family)